MRKEGRLTDVGYILALLGQLKCDSDTHSNESRRTALVRKDVDLILNIQL